MIPETIRDRFLYMRHYPVTSAHPGGRGMYTSLRRNLYWPGFALNCYTTVKQCRSCTKNTVLLRKHRKELHLFAPQEPLEFVAIDILGLFPRTKMGKLFVLMITDRYSNLTKSIPMKNIGGKDVAQAFVKQWAANCGPPLWLLSDNGRQFAAKLLTRLCDLVNTTKLFTTTYHPQSNG